MTAILAGGGGVRSEGGEGVSRWISECYILLTSFKYYLHQGAASG
jgi:hypothetical protein